MSSGGSMGREVLRKWARAKLCWRHRFPQPLDLQARLSNVTSNTDTLVHIV